MRGERGSLCVGGRGWLMRKERGDFVRREECVCVWGGGVVRGERGDFVCEGRGYIVRRGGC